MPIRTYNFKEKSYSYEVKDEFRGEFTDLRNGIICANPTCDFDCYINYIALLNSKRDSWINYGYLDLGMMPIAMGPSFMQAGLRDIMLKLCKRIGLQIYSRRPVSVMYDKCNLSLDDVWAFKDDVAKVTGLPVEGLTLEKFIRWCKNEHIGIE